MINIPPTTITPVDDGWPDLMPGLVDGGASSYSCIQKSSHLLRTGKVHIKTDAAPEYKLDYTTVGTAEYYYFRDLKQYSEQYKALHPTMDKVLLEEHLITKAYDLLSVHFGSYNTEVTKGNGLNREEERAGALKITPEIRWMQGETVCRNRAPLISGALEHIGIHNLLVSGWLDVGDGVPIGHVWVVTDSGLIVDPSTKKAVQHSIGQIMIGDKGNITELSQNDAALRTRQGYNIMTERGFVYSTGFDGSVSQQKLIERRSRDNLHAEKYTLPVANTIAIGAYGDVRRWYIAGLDEVAQDIRDNPSRRYAYKKDLLAEHTWAASGITPPWCKEAIEIVHGVVLAKSSEVVNEEVHRKMLFFARAADNTFHLEEKDVVGATLMALRINAKDKPVSITTKELGVIQTLARGLDMKVQCNGSYNPLFLIKGSDKKTMDVPVDLSR